MLVGCLSHKVRLKKVVIVQSNYYVNLHFYTTIERDELNIFNCTMDNSSCRNLIIAPIVKRIDIQKKLIATTDSC